jgi:hypothetical protein
MFLAGEKLDVKYDPDTKAGINELFLYREDTPVGTAKLINYTDNAKRKRLGSNARTDRRPLVAPHKESNGAEDCSLLTQKTNTISYSVMGGE